METTGNLVVASHEIKRVAILTTELTELYYIVNFVASLKYVYNATLCKAGELLKLFL